MIQDILGHTPLWVWAILVLLIVRGLAAARAREGALGPLYILPLVMLAISLQSISGRFGMAALPWASWICGFAVGGALGWISLAPSAVALAPKGVRLTGSYWPLALILGVFCVRYASEVLRAIYPEMMLEPLPVATLSIVTGLVSGVFVGRVLRITALAAALRQGAPAAAAG